MLMMCMAYQRIHDTHEYKKEYNVKQRVRIVFFLTLLLWGIASSTSKAQIQHSAFFAPSATYSAFAGVSAEQGASFVGASFGWVMDFGGDMLVLGASYETMMKSISSGLPPRVIPVGTPVPYLDMNFGGVTIEYIRRVSSVVDVSCGVLLAGAGSTLTVREDIPNKPVYFSKDWNVWMPHVSLQYGLTSWCKAECKLSYRYITGRDSQYTILPSDLQGTAIGIAFRFGRY
jgi:hypothetical protein